MLRLLSTIARLGVYGLLALVACQSEDAPTQEEGNTTEDATIEPVTLTSLVGWGDNFMGQLGNGISLPYGNTSTTPVEVVNLNGVDLKAVAAGSNHSLALKEDGTVLAWGLNQDGQLGDETTTDSSSPVQVKDSNDPTSYLTSVQQIAAGSTFSLALKDDGTVWAWGGNQAGELGDGTNTTSSTPVQVSGLSEVKVISGGSQYSLALKDDGTVWAWGSNKTNQDSKIGGQLGDDEITSSNTPVEVSDLPSGVIAIAAGAGHSLALKDDGTVWAWGSNQSGELGNGTRDFSPILGYNTPVQVSELSGVKVIAVGADYNLAGW